MSKCLVCSAETETEFGFIGNIEAQRANLAVLLADLEEARETFLRNADVLEDVSRLRYALCEPCGEARGIEVGPDNPGIPLIPYYAFPGEGFDPRGRA